MSIRLGRPGRPGKPGSGTVTPPTGGQGAPMPPAGPVPPPRAPAPPIVSPRNTAPGAHPAITPPAGTVELTATNGRRVSFVPQIIGQGGMKDVYFSPDHSYVVAFFREPLGGEGRDRLAAITGTFRERIFGQAGGAFWPQVFCWPEAMVEWQGKVGVVVPAYARHFFFEFGSKNGDTLGIKGKEKEGKWFASASNRQRFLDPRELGHWLNYLRINLLIARAVRRLHAAGLAHSDLSYKNVLVDPAGGHAAVIDLDGLVVPGKFPPDVAGTPDFIAPEVVATQHLNRHNPARKLPSIQTDRHALAVLIYMYLLYRHPLRGRAVYDTEDPQADEKLAMGEKALFVEHPTDTRNRVNVAELRPTDLPWGDPGARPYTLTGPHLVPLFKRAFIDGLHNPDARPTADEWESGLVRTVDLIQPCPNPACEQKWYVFDNTTRPVCPFCGTPHRGLLPVLNFYSRRGGGGSGGPAHASGSGGSGALATSFQPDNARLMVYTGQSLFRWHTDRSVFPNERLTDDEKKRVGYFVFHEGRWWWVNEALPNCTDRTGATPVPVPIGGRVELTEGRKVLFSDAPTGRLMVVQLVGGTG